MKIDIESIRGLANSLDLPFEDLIDPLKDSLLAAFLQSKGQLPERPQRDEPIAREVEGRKIRIDLDVESGEVRVMVEELSEDGEVLGEVNETPANFSIIATHEVKRFLGDRLQKQVQKQVADGYASNLFTLVNGVIQQGADKNLVFVDLGKVEAKMPPAEQVPTEKYVHGQRLRVLLVAVQEFAGADQLVVSRTHPGLVKALFALEVPEVADGTVEIMALSREAGSRSKMAVLSHNPAVAAKGACIGPKGSRVTAVVNELNGEKIDIVDYSEDPAKFIGAAIAPASVSRVDIVDLEAKHARVFVPEFQLSLAIGKEGQNARLAARLTGWKIDIRSDTDPLFSAPTGGEEG